MRVHPGRWLALLVGLAACSSGAGGSSASDMKETIRSYNASSQELVDHLLAMQSRALIGIQALNQGNYAGYDAYAGGVRADLSKAESIAQSLYDSAAVLHSQASSPTTKRSRGSIGKVEQPLGVLETLAILAAAGAFIKWVKDTGSEVDKSIKDGQKNVSTFIENRTNYWVNQGFPPETARNLATKDSEQVRVHEGLSAAKGVGTTLVTQTGKQLAESALGAAIPGANVVIDFKNAADTGTLIGESLCPKPEGTQVKSFEGTCRLYVGTSANGQFSDVPTGSWNLAATSGSFAPNGLGDQDVSGPVTISDWESPEQACGDACSGAGGSQGTGGSGGPSTGACVDFVGAIQVMNPDGESIPASCISCLETYCSGPCGSCMNAQCVAEYGPCAMGCDNEHSACFSSCSGCGENDCSDCYSACNASFEACDDGCNATSAGQLMNQVGACSESACQQACGF